MQFFKYHLINIKLFDISENINIIYFLFVLFEIKNYYFQKILLLISNFLKSVTFKILFVNFIYHRIYKSLFTLTKWICSVTVHYIDKTEKFLFFEYVKYIYIYIYINNV